MRQYSFDERRMIALPGDDSTTIDYCVQHWIDLANASIAEHDFFAVALSGGSTPKKIYKRLCSPSNASEVDWSKVFLFWSDERSVAPSSEESNFHMAMEGGGLAKLPIPQNQIFRMVAETDIERNALEYEKIITKKLADHSFDLVMLGMGEDGHTASLFPHTRALKETNRLVMANEVPQKKTWRMTFTFPLINAAHHICIYVLGETKASILATVLTSNYDPETHPVQKIGTSQNKVLWIVDDTASKDILAHLQ